MCAVKRISVICLAAIALCLVSMGARGEGLCGGETFARFETDTDRRPRVRLDIGGVQRPVLLDTGATSSTLFNDASADDSRVVAAIELGRWNIRVNTMAPGTRRKVSDQPR